MTDLKPCPFCKAEIHSNHMTDIHDIRCYFVAREVLCDPDDLERINVWWNNRPIEDAQAEKIVELENIIKIWQDAEKKYSDAINSQAARIKELEYALSLDENKLSRENYSLGLLAKKLDDLGEINEARIAELEERIRDLIPVDTIEAMKDWRTEVVAKDQRIKELEAVNGRAVNAMLADAKRIAELETALRKI